MKNDPISKFPHLFKRFFGTGCSLNSVLFPRILESLPPLPRQPSPAIGCTKNHQPIGVTVHSRWELWRSLTAMFARLGLQWIVEKRNFSWTPCIFLHELQLLFLIGFYIILQEIPDCNVRNTTSLGQGHGWTGCMLTIMQKRSSSNSLIQTH